MMYYEVYEEIRKLTPFIIKIDRAEPFHINVINDRDIGSHDINKYCVYSTNMDLVIYSKKEELTEGAFGQALTWLLEILHKLEDNGIVTDDSKIVFDVNAIAYGNLIPTYIVPKNNPLSEMQYLPQNIINIKQVKMLNHLDFNFHESSFMKAHKIWNKYFEFSDEIYENIPTFDGNVTLGVHYRGTDKTRDSNETNPITQDEFIYIIDDYLNKHKEFKNIFCASDEASFLDAIKKKYSNLNIIEYKQKRSDSGEALHLMKVTDETERHERTIAALVDMVALSRCHTILKVSSALSAFSKILNPNVSIYTVSAMKQPWFPTGVVKSYKTASPIISMILSRTMQGDCYNM